VFAEILFHVVPGDVHDGLHVPDARLRVHEVGHRRRHCLVHPVAVAPEVHGERVRRPARERGRFAFDHVRVHRLLEEYRQLYRRVQTGRGHRVHERFAARQIRALVGVTAARRFRRQSDARCNTNIPRRGYRRSNNRRTRSPTVYETKDGYEPIGSNGPVLIW